MRVMLLEVPGHPLCLTECPIPTPAPHQVLLKVHACGVCRTDLHVVDGDLTQPKLPLVLGHQIVGTVVEKGTQVMGLSSGDRIGVPWLGQTCNHCHYCHTGRENLCDQAQFTGYTLDGGYADYAVAEAQFCFPLPSGYPDVQVAPLLCAGLIGYRSYRMTGEAKHLVQPRGSNPAV